MGQISKSDFTFKKHMTIGEADAENDESFLSECFVDIGDYDVLCDTSTPQCIVLGRTGVGKSALLEQIEATAERTIRIEPEELALRHISNSTILNFFEGLGVNLDIFYNLLWQHTFAVELIKKQYNIDSPQAKINFMDNIKALLTGNRKKLLALAYIEEWGDKFWLDTESRIKDFTKKLETKLSAEMAENLPSISMSASASASLSEEQKSEVIYYGKKVVSSVQIDKLSKIINLLAEDIFTDEKQKTYILIDKLDENWVDDNLRYKLIRALIETVKKFRRIKSVKIIFTLRTDLMDRVLKYTRDSGFQKEKYLSLFLTIRWTKEQIKEVLDSRINSLLRHKYTKEDVCFDDVFPPKMDKITGAEYIIERTLLRPRDAIMFVNLCLSESEGKSMITSAIVKVAEKYYSLSRIESLEYEWFVEHPTLKNYIDILNQKNNKFKVSTLSEETLESIILSLVESDSLYSDSATKAAVNYFNSTYPQSTELFTMFRQNLLFTLYKVGVVGIKVDTSSTILWIHNRAESLTPLKIASTSVIYIHKLLWKALAIDVRN